MKAVKPAPAITLFNAFDRFYMCRRKLLDLGKALEDISTINNPGVIDLIEQYALLRALTNKTGTKLENGSARKSDRITERDLLNVERLEVLIHEFQSTLKDACKELLAA